MGQRIRRECEAIVSEIVVVEPRGLDSASRRDLVVKCLLESAIRGRR